MKMEAESVRESEMPPDLEAKGITEKSHTLRDKGKKRKTNEAKCGAQWIRKANRTGS